MTRCPFCSDLMLRHIRASRIYWLCRRCRLESLTLLSDRPLQQFETDSNSPKPINPSIDSSLVEEAEHLQRFLQ